MNPGQQIGFQSRPVKNEKHLQQLKMDMFVPAYALSLTRRESTCWGWPETLFQPVRPIFEGHVGPKRINHKNLKELLASSKVTFGLPCGGQGRRITSQNLIVGGNYSARVVQDHLTDGIAPIWMTKWHAVALEHAGRWE